MLAVLVNSMDSNRRRKMMMERFKDSQDCCRTCLSQIDLQPLFDDCENSTERSLHLLKTTGLKIHPDDGYPQSICEYCLKRFEESIDFRMTALKAINELISMGYMHRKDKIGAETTTKKSPNQQSADLMNASDSKCCEVKLSDPILVGDFDGAGDDFGYDDDDNELMLSIEPKKIRRIYKKSELKCEECKKQYKLRASYIAHMRIHNNYSICELCGKKCRSNNLLHVHKMSRHGAEKIHKCMYCEYSAANKEALVVHERHHTGEKPYICDYCGSSFRRRSTLIQHIAVHLPNKDFQCPVCQKMFRSRRFLNIHTFNTHKTKKYSYVCDICSTHFTTTDSTRKHLSRAHGVPREEQGQIKRIPNHKI